MYICLTKLYRKYFTINSLYCKLFIFFFIEIISKNKVLKIKDIFILHI